MKFRLNGRGGRLIRSGAPSAADQAEALLAAAAPLDAVYEMTQGSVAGRAFYSRALEVGYREIGGTEWPFEGELGEHGEVIVREGGSLVAELPDGSLAWLAVGHGWFRVTVAAPSRDLVEGAIAAFAGAYPALYRQETDAATVPVTFWTYTKYGPQSRLRMIEASPWDEVERNYSAEVRAELGDLMTDFEPGKSGQLLLWQGPPGTGKTWALRALASEWRSWAEFNYITDPDAFFVTNPDYLIDVLLSDSYEELAVIEEEGDPELVTTDRLGKWRVLILEDTGELLAANAKESYGQGLSRLLNVVDGLVGQGLRILVLVTTNDELGELHPAVKRPGRCASQIEFGPLSAEDASAWLGEETDEGGTLAELYARRGDGAEPLTASAVDKNSDGAMVALYPTPPQAGALALEGGQAPEDLHVTLVYLGQASDVDAAKVRNALGTDLGKPLGGAAGDVFQFPEGDDGVPLNVAPSVPGLEELRAEVLRRLEAAGIEDASSFSDWTPHICLAYDGDPALAATKVGLPLSFDSLSICVGGDRTDVPLAPASASETASERWDRLARSLEDEVEQEGAQELAASLQVPRRRSGGKMAALLASMQAMSQQTSQAMLAAVLALAEDEDEAPAQTIEVHNHLPAHNLNVRVDPPTVQAPNVTVEPARIEPHFTVEASRAPDVHVQVQPPEIRVEAPPAPNVELRPEIRVEAPNVTVEPPEVHVTVEPTRPSAVRAIKEDDGSTVFVVEEEEETE